MRLRCDCDGALPVLPVEYEASCCWAKVGEGTAVEGVLQWLTCASQRNAALPPRLRDHRDLRNL